MDASTVKRVQRAITDLSESHGSSAADATDIDVANETNALSESVIACLALQRNVTRELARRISLLIDAPDWDIVFVDPNDYDSPFGILLVDDPVILHMVDPSNWPALDAHIGEQARRHAIAHFFGEDALVRPTGSNYEQAMELMTFLYTLGVRTANAPQGRNGEYQVHHIDPSRFRSSPLLF